MTHFLLHALERADTSISFSTVAILLYLFVTQVLRYLVHKITYAILCKLIEWTNMYANLQD